MGGIRLRALFLAALVALTVTGTAAGAGRGVALRAAPVATEGASWSRGLLAVILILGIASFGRWLAGGPGNRGGGTGQGWYRDLGGGRGSDHSVTTDSEPRSRDTRSGHWRDGDWSSHEPGADEPGDRDPDEA